MRALTTLLPGLISALTCLAAVSAELPLRVWVLYDPCSDRACMADQRVWAGGRVESHVARANEILATARFQLRAHTIRVRTEPAFLENVIDVGCTDNGQRIRASLGHVPGHINVYYVRHPGAKGLWCAPDSILIGVSAYPETLAHEVGHALSLEHAYADTGAHDNLMGFTGAMSHLTSEQVQRIRRSLKFWLEQTNTAPSAATTPEGR